MPTETDLDNEDVAAIDNPPPGRETREAKLMRTYNQLKRSFANVPLSGCVVDKWRETLRKHLYVCHWNPEKVTVEALTRCYTAFKITDDPILGVDECEAYKRWLNRNGYIVFDFVLEY